MEPVYLAAMATRVAPLHDPLESADALFPPGAGDGLANRLARKLAKTIGIAQRPSVLDPSRWPARALARPEDAPVRWCAGMAGELSAAVGREGVGHLSVAYNVSSDPDVLPSLSARVAAASGFALDRPPEERAFYGCAGALFSLEGAAAYCRASARASVVLCFDQCSWLVHAPADVSAPDFGDHLRTALLFGDGAAGLLVVPEELRARLAPGTPLLRILEVATDFVPGTSVHMEGGRLLLGKDLKDAMPEAASSRLVRPMLARHGLCVGAIDEWSIHQGGLPILARFSEEATLGLPAEKLARSRELFLRYGNFSAPSCLFVLQSFFEEGRAAPAARAGRRGVVLSFGAGYYLGALLYEWVAPRG